MPKFKNFSCYGENGRKIEYMTDTDIDINPMVEQVIVDGKVAGVFEGVDTTTVTIQGAVCVDGKEDTRTIRKNALEKKAVVYTFGIIDGSILSCEMTVSNLKYTGKAANGSTVFSCTLQGGRVSEVG